MGATSSSKVPSSHCDAAFQALLLAGAADSSPAAPPKAFPTCLPKQEMDAFSACNSDLVELVCMIRAWRDRCNVSMSGMLIDTLAYQFTRPWRYRDRSYFYYD